MNGERNEDEKIAGTQAELRRLKQELGEAYWRNGEVMALQQTLRRLIGAYGAWGEHSCRCTSGRVLRPGSRARAPTCFGPAGLPADEPGCRRTPAMRFEAPLVRGILIRRYKRFLADVALGGGEIVTAHCPNSGSMLSVDVPGAEVWLSPAPDPRRKLAFTWELIRLGEALVGINTGRPSALAAEAIATGTIAELAGYETVRREVRCGRNARIDLLLEAKDRPNCFVEVKNVTLQRPSRPGLVEFPDCATARGVKHLVELATAVASGHRAVMLFLAQRGDGDLFAIADDIDPGFVTALNAAVAAGVELLCYRCAVSVDEIRVSDRLAFAGASCEPAPARAFGGMGR